MLKLKVISFFLVLLLTLQVLPIAQIGNMLVRNQWTEELPHETDAMAKSVLNDDDFTHPFISDFYHYTGVSVSIETKALAYIHLSEQIPTNHSTEVVTPPPDRV